MGTIYYSIIGFALISICRSGTIQKHCFEHEGTDSYTCLTFIDHVSVTWMDGARMCESRGSQLLTTEVRQRLDFRFREIDLEERCEFWINGTDAIDGCTFIKCPGYVIETDVLCEGTRPIVCQDVTYNYYRNKVQAEFFKHKLQIIIVGVLLSIITVSLMVYFARKWRERVLNKNRVAPLDYYYPPEYRDK